MSSIHFIYNKKIAKTVGAKDDKQYEKKIGTPIMGKQFFCLFIKINNFRR